MYTIYRFQSADHWTATESRRTLHAAISYARCAAVFTGVKHAVVDLDYKSCFVAIPDVIRAENEAILRRRESNILVG